jgi:hypothetical protein
MTCVPSAGFEPALFGPSDRCLLPLGYEGLVPRQGFEPQFQRPERCVLPVGRPGNERTVDGSRTRYSCLEGRRVTVDTPTAWQRVGELNPCLQTEKLAA